MPRPFDVSFARSYGARDSSRKDKWWLVACAEVIGKPPRRVALIDAQQYDALSGEYVLDMNGRPITSRVWRDGTRLMTQTESQDPEELMPESETVFCEANTPEAGSPDNIVERGSSGRVEVWICKAGDIAFRSVKVSGAQVPKGSTAPA